MHTYIHVATRVFKEVEVIFVYNVLSLCWLLLQNIATTEKFFLDGSEDVSLTILGRRLRPGSSASPDADRDRTVLSEPKTDVVEWRLLPLTEFDGTIDTCARGSFRF